MKTIQPAPYTVYTAAELKASFPTGFECALSEHRDSITQESYWSEAVTDDFLQILALCGFNVDIKDISWSGFWSQGDGASFTGSVVFDPAALQKVQEYAPKDESLHSLASECAAYGVAGIRAVLSRNSHHYSHENTVSIDSAWTESPEGEEISLDDDKEKEVLEICRSFMCWFYRQLEKEYKYQASEENFLETAEANEWTFTASGKMDNS